MAGSISTIMPLRTRYDLWWRKNFLFAGSHDGAKRIAMIYSFFASCKEADVNPYAWMTDTLNRIGNHPIDKLSGLLPGNFQK